MSEAEKMMLDDAIQACMDAEREVIKLEKEIQLAHTIIGFALVVSLIVLSIVIF